MQKSLILFDLENQSAEIQKIKDWDLKWQFEFRGYTIKSGAMPLNTDVHHQFIILVGESTKYLSKQFYEDLDAIILTTKPILCLNLNGYVGLEEKICPIVLHDSGAIHMAFSNEDLAMSLDYIKPDAKIVNPNGSYHFKKDPRSFY
ncbi:MAG: hypothetical protein EOO95_06395 [Pedobacter sp.]|nr:MAG: hypothetical protein EOO95_06395 [Pedobacter sp.]